MDKLKRFEHENEFDYHKRIVFGKLKDKTLADEDYCELSKLVYGKEYSSDVARRMMYGSRHTLELIDSILVDGVADCEVLNRLIDVQREIKKERYKLFDERNAYNKMLRNESRREEIKEIIERVISDTYPTPLEFKPKDCVEYVKGTLLVSLNDLHIGSNINNRWNVYNSDVCRDRLSEYLDKIKTIAKTHSSKDCVVWCNGDVISGSIHKSIAITNKENVIEQLKVASEMIAQFLAELSYIFSSGTVRFVSVAGNHSRIDKKDDALKDERLDDLVEWYLNARLQNFKNIKLDEYDKIDSTMYSIDVEGLTFLGVHGDYDTSVSKMQSLQMMLAPKQLYAILLGHLHHNNTNSVQGVRLIMAGSMLGVDDYCVAKRIFGKAEQMVSVVSKDGIICNYNIVFESKKD